MAVRYETEQPFYMSDEPKLELARYLGKYCDSKPVWAESFGRISI